MQEKSTTNTYKGLLSITSKLGVRLNPKPDRGLDLRDCETPRTNAGVFRDKPTTMRLVTGTHPARNRLHDAGHLETRTCVLHHGITPYPLKRYNTTHFGITQLTHCITESPFRKSASLPQHQYTRRGQTVSRAWECSSMASSRNEMQNGRTAPRPLTAAAAHAGIV